MTSIRARGLLASPGLVPGEPGGIARLMSLAMSGCALGVLLLAAAPSPPASRTAIPIPAAHVTASEAEPTTPPFVRSAPQITAQAEPPDLGLPVGARVPTWESASVAREVLPSPQPVDPVVQRALAELRTAATDDARGPRPGPAALVAMAYALDQVGDPYVWGATGPATYDCSGLTWRSYRAAGLELPRVSRDQFAGGGELVDVDDLLPGDLVFFATADWDPGVVHHVGMYVGKGLMVDAPRPGLTVRVEPVWAEGYVGAVRPVPANGYVTPDAPSDRSEPPHRRPTPSTHPTPRPERPTTEPTPAPTNGPTTGTPTPSATQATPTGATMTTPAPTPTTIPPTPTTAPSLVLASPILLTPLQLAPTSLVLPTGTGD